MPNEDLNDHSNTSERNSLNRLNELEFATEDEKVVSLLAFHVAGLAL